MEPINILVKYGTKKELSPEEKDKLLRDLLNILFDYAKNSNGALLGLKVFYD